MSARQVLQSYTLLRIAGFDARFDARSVVNLNGFAVSSQVCNHITPTYFVSDLHVNGIKFLPYVPPIFFI